MGRCPPGTPIKLRLMALSEVDEKTGCWLWTGAKTDRGYGIIGITTAPGVYEMRPAHRVAYEEFIAPIPEGLQLDHLCRVRRCINANHLEPVTCGENLRRGEGFTGLNFRKTHCKHGHEFTPENTGVARSGGKVRGRYCKECNRIGAGKQRARIAANLPAGKRKPAKVRERHPHRPATHCQRGHEFTPENTVPQKSYYGKTARLCRACANASRGRYRDRNRERINSAERARKRLSRAENPEAHRASDRRYHEQHREEINARKRAWRRKAEQ